MKRYIFLVVAILAAANAAAEVVVKSCDALFSAKNSRGSLIIERAGKVVGISKIDHEIDGGAFSDDDSLLIVYGLPKNISRRGPQRTLLSVFRVRRASRFIKEEYGSRVYNVSFGIDRRMVVVDSGFGVDVIDLVKRTSTFYDQGYMPNFAIKKCEK
ncbi:hypothetical protein [Burkholderia vietnamiensis]|uniref:hypothetical protein n=1 Tax=Burkholderia vietnamiensis TaxID=60552 RepID=UPI0012D9E99F|nr:hypothetical protein [Burkholderia vietnamiensis]